MPNGPWTIVIQGQGSYGDQDVFAQQDDADRLASAFISQLQALGHTIDNSNFLTSEPSTIVISSQKIR